MFYVTELTLEFDALPNNAQPFHGPFYGEPFIPDWPPAPPRTPPATSPPPRSRSPTTPPSPMRFPSPVSSYSLNRPIAVRYFFPERTSASARPHSPDRPSTSFRPYLPSRTPSRAGPPFPVRLISSVVPPSLRHPLRLQKVTFSGYPGNTLLVGTGTRTYRHIRPKEQLSSISNSNSDIVGILGDQNIVRGVYNSAQKRVIVSMATGRSRRIRKEEINQLPAGRPLRPEDIIIRVPGIYYLP